MHAYYKNLSCVILKTDRFTVYAFSLYDPHSLVSIFKHNPFETHLVEANRFCSRKIEIGLYGS